MLTSLTTLRRLPRTFHPRPTSFTSLLTPLPPSLLPHPHPLHRAMSHLRYLGAIDQGTSSTRFILFTSHGAVVDKHQIPLTSHHPSHLHGWTEQSPLDMLRDALHCIDTVMARHPDKPVAAVGVTNQRETTVVWDRDTGEPVHDAIVWHDSRTAGLVGEVTAREGGIDAWRERTGLPISTYFSALKLHWILHIAPTLPPEQVPSLSPTFRASCPSPSPTSPPHSPTSPHLSRLMFGTVDSWLIWKLTGGPASGRHVTDVTNASRTLMMDLRTCQWDPSILSALAIPPSLLPTIRPSSHLYGSLTSSLLKGTPLAGCLGDQQAALVGQLGLHPGDVKSTYGTGAFLMLNTGGEVVHSEHGLLSTVAYQLGGEGVRYALEGSVGVAGAAVQWLRDQMGVISSAAEVDSSAASVPSARGLYFVPAFSGLLSPYYRPDARGLLIGITHSTTRHHLARATLDASAYQTAVVLRAMAHSSPYPPRHLRVDGGMAASDVLCQSMADLCALPVVRPVELECTAAGAAYAAGLGVGVWGSVEQMVSEVRRGRGEERVFEPRMTDGERAKLMRGWDRAVERSIGWVEAGDPLAGDEEEGGDVVRPTKPTSKL